MEKTQAIEEVKTPQKLESAATSIKTRIEAVLNDEKFLESLLTLIETPEDFMNLCRSIMNINRKISDIIHLIQDLSIMSSSSRANAIIQIGLFTRNLTITLPWSTPNTKRVVLSLLTDLESVVTQCISLNEGLFHLSNQSEWDCDEIVKETETRILNVTDDNQDSICILRQLVDWDYENGWTVGPANSAENSPKIWSFQWNCILPRERDENRFRIRGEPTEEKNSSSDSSILQIFKRPFLGIISVITLISVSLMSLFSKGKTIFQHSNLLSIKNNDVL